MPKAVVVHAKASAVEKSWSTQYAGLDPDTRKQFDGIADFDKRVQQVFTITALTWDSIVTTMQAAAKAAGQDGVVVIASGHGARIPNDTFGGMVNWDPTEHDTDRAWNDETRTGSGLFWDEVTTIYTQVIPKGNPPTRQKEDEAAIANKKSNAKLAQKRHDAFDAYEKIGKALKSAGVKRLTFTVCCFGEASGFVDRMASQFGIEVAAFTENTVVLDEFTSFKIIPSKARMVIERDAKVNDEKTTNKMIARVNSPDLDDTSIAYVGGKKKP